MTKTVGLRRRKSKHNDDVREDLRQTGGEQADPDGSPWGVGAMPRQNEAAGSLKAPVVSWDEGPAEPSTGVQAARSSAARPCSGFRIERAGGAGQDARLVSEGALDGPMAHVLLDGTNVVATERRVRAPYWVPCTCWFAKSLILFPLGLLARGFCRAGLVRVV
jgi:hypothetical protein